MKKMKKQRKKEPLGLGRWIVIVICAIVFFASAGYIGLYAKDKMRAQSDFAELEQGKDSGIEKLYEKNNDFVGWLTVKGTKIDYPVMQTPDDFEYYLHRDFNKEYSVSGTPFIDGYSVMSGQNKTWNWFIYGHNMKFGTMFHDLLKYESKGFWKGHKTFTFDTYLPKQSSASGASGAADDADNSAADDADNSTASADNSTASADSAFVEDNGTYKIFAACYSKIREKDSKKFKYYQFSAYTNEESFDEYVKGVKEESIYNTEITPKFGDQLVTLSTCAYHTDNGRFYVVGVKQ